MYTLRTNVPSLDFWQDARDVVGSSRSFVLQQQPIIISYYKFRQTVNADRADDVVVVMLVYRTHARTVMNPLYLQIRVMTSRRYDRIL